MKLSDTQVAQLETMKMEHANRANIAKLEQLIRDCNAKINEAESMRKLRDEVRFEDDANQHYWIGMRSGLQRSLNVLKGNG